MVRKRTGPCTLNAVGLLSLDVETRGLPPLAPPPRVCGEVYLTLPYLTHVRLYPRICRTEASTALREIELRAGRGRGAAQTPGYDSVRFKSARERVPQSAPLRHARVRRALRDQGS